MLHYTTSFVNPKHNFKSRKLDTKDETYCIISYKVQTLIKLSMLVEVRSVLFPVEEGGHSYWGQCLCCSGLGFIVRSILTAPTVFSMILCKQDVV